MPEPFDPNHIGFKLLLTQSDERKTVTLTISCAEPIDVRGVPEIIRRYADQLSLQMRQTVAQKSKLILPS